MSRPKCEFFWWRVLNEYLPTRQIPFRKHVEPLQFCEVCGFPEESIKHVLTECTIAKMFWHDIKQLTGTKMPALHPLSWASDILCPEVCSDKDRCLLIISMYTLWSQRNKRRHGEDQVPIRAAVQWAVDLGINSVIKGRFFIRLLSLVAINASFTFSIMLSHIS